MKKKVKKETGNFLYVIVCLICEIIWPFMLSGTDGRNLIYILLAVLSLLASISLYVKPAEKCKRDKVCSIVYAGLLTLASTMSNYWMFYYSDGNVVTKILYCTVLLLTGFLTLLPLSRFLIDRLKGFTWKIHEHKINPIFIWLAATAILFFIYYIAFYAKYYPGVLTADSISQIYQAITGNFTNHHPVYHTFILQALINVGASMGLSVMDSIAWYTIFQMLLLSVVYAYTIMTMYETKLSWWIVSIAMVVYALMPYNIAYASTVWKDIVFAIAVTAFVTSLYRTMANVGKYRWANYLILVLSGLGFCIFRSNGMFAFAITLAALAILFKKSKLRETIILIAVLAVAIILKYPVLSGLNIPQHDTVEALSIPVQQIARVVAEGNELTEEEYNTISGVADINRIYTEYTPYLSDPIKDMIRQCGNQEDIKQNKLKYIKLYLTLGLKHPMEYINAWVDQTKGYWNGGYDYWVWTEGVIPNDYGIQNNGHNAGITALQDEYFYRFQNSKILQLFISIGLHSWILAGLCMLCIAKKSKKMILTVPVLAILLSIVISTPLYTEFRYIYSMFASLPVTLIAVLSKNEFD